jgi:hypothetical protein
LHGSGAISGRGGVLHAGPARSARALQADPSAACLARLALRLARPRIGVGEHLLHRLLHRCLDQRFGRHDRLNDLQARGFGVEGADRQLGALVDVLGRLVFQLLVRLVGVGLGVVGDLDGLLQLLLELRDLLVSSAVVGPFLFPRAGGSP